MSRLFVFGLGYTGSALSRRLEPRGWSVTGTMRGAERPGAIGFDGQAPVPGLAARLEGASHVLVSVPPKEGDPVLRHHRAELAARSGALKWIGYLSTVGVYGDHAGGWVDEDTPVRPVSERSRRRLAAETAWLSFGEETGIPVSIFRLAGIYGPGRNALAALKRGTARRVVKPGQVFNRCHVDDIAAALEVSMGRPVAGRIYNIADDEPAPPQEVVGYAARLLGVEPPPEIEFAAAGMTEMARSFYDENKRVRNAKIKEELGVRLAYPDFRTGLDALYAAGEGA